MSSVSSAIVCSAIVPPDTARHQPAQKRAPLGRALPQLPLRSPRPPPTAASCQRSASQGEPWADRERRVAPRVR